MGSERYRRAPRSTGTRYCRARRRRGAVPRSVLAVRHGADGLVLAYSRPRAVPAPRRRSRWGPLAFGAGVSGLILSVTLLLSGPFVGSAPELNPCADHSSVAAYAEGYVLRLRAEPATGPATLVHLCAEPAIGAVRDWAVGVAGDGPDSGAGRPGIQRVTGQSALASVPLAPGRHTDLTVTLVAGTGRTLVFATRLPAA